MSRGRSVRPQVLAAAAILGCSATDPPRGGADAGPGEDASLWEPDIAEPAPPAPPRMTPCPRGWREDVRGDDPDLVTCDPWPEGGRRQDCAEDEAHFPGGPGCVRIGPPCPDGQWPAELPESTRVLYVRAGERKGGDGTRDRPFGRIADAIVGAEDGDVIALSKGLFDEEVRIDRAVTLVGACVLDTRIAPSERGSQPAALTVRAAAMIRDLQVGGAEVGVDLSRTDGMARLESIVVREATGVGVLAWFDATVAAADLVVRDTMTENDDFGYGLEVERGAHLALERVALERNHGFGALVGEEGTSLTAADLLVSDTLTTRSGGEFGFGLEVWGQAHAALERAVVEGNRSVGVLTIEAGSALAATDLVVSDNGGNGIETWGGAVVTLVRAAVVSNRGVGAMVAESATILMAADLVVVDTLAQGDGTFGYGLDVHAGAKATVERAAVERNRGVGVLVDGEGTELTATDLVVSQTLGQESDGYFGYGLEAAGAASVTVDRALLVGNRAAGLLFTQEGTELVASDLTVSHTRSRDVDGHHGVGVAILSAARAEITRSRLLESRGYALRASGPRTTVTAAELTVQSTMPQACAVDVCPETGGGIGLASDSGADLCVRRFRSADNALVGVLVASDSQLDLHEGIVSGNRIGANVQIDGFDFARLQDRVAYIDNDVNTDRTSFDLPEPPEALERVPEVER